jgi:ABC-type Mn2+/Zn2+ transport system permease subunit
MSLAADPLSHVALPGIGVALALHREPLFGAVAALLLGAFLVWVLQGKARATTEAIIGVVFSAGCWHSQCAYRRTGSSWLQPSVSI